MKIRMLTSLAGVNFALSPGDEYECSAEQAARFIEKGMAEPVRAVKKEKAVKRRKGEKAAK